MVILAGVETMHLTKKPVNEFTGFFSGKSGEKLNQKTTHG
jgi:hypothetical protein